MMREPVVIEKGKGLTSKVSGQEWEGERGKLHIITMYISPEIMKPKVTNIRLVLVLVLVHETSTSNPVSAHKTEHLKGKDHLEDISSSVDGRIILKCK
jgi:hypothetical protein